MMINGVVVRTEVSRSTAKDVEALVTVPIERLLITLPGVESVRSTSMEHLSLVEVRYADAQPDSALALVAAAIDGIRGGLPALTGQPVLSALPAGSDGRSA